MTAPRLLHARVPQAGVTLRDVTDVHRHIGAVCFKTGPPGTVGAELEWLVADTREPHLPVPPDRVRRAAETAGDLPGGSVLSLEPGGQVELSSQPAPGVPGRPALDACRTALAADVDHLTDALARAGLCLLPTAADPLRPPHRGLQAPRYEAMERYFAARAGLGRHMMCSTAATQVCLDAGADAADVVRRWRLLHAVGPALVAAFANSPRLHGRPERRASWRQHVWSTVDRWAPCRLDGDPVAAWAEHALAAPVMSVRRDEEPWLADPGCTFGAWLDGDAGLGPPTAADLDHHLSTLFPPVRPRAYLEVRYLDAQPGRWWPVPIAVLVALVEDGAAGDAALDAADQARGDTADPWSAAARHGTSDPALGRAASACLAAALEALPRLGAAAATVDLVAAFADRWTFRGRCPADDEEP